MFFFLLFLFLELFSGATETEMFFQRPALDPGDRVQSLMVVFTDELQKVRGAVAHKKGVCAALHNY